VKSTAPNNVQQLAITNWRNHLCTLETPFSKKLPQANFQPSLQSQQWLPLLAQWLTPPSMAPLIKPSQKAQPQLLEN
jgi:hypothetical protein